MTKFAQGFLHELSKLAFVGPSNSQVGAFVSKLRSAFPQSKKVQMGRAMKITGGGSPLKSPVSG